MDRDNKFELPENFEKILASLSKYYKQNENDLMNKVIVNAKYKIHEEWSYDSWDGGIYGHAVFFELPENLFFDLMNHQEEIASQLREDINKIANIHSEHIVEVFLELQDNIVHNWRETSGELIEQHDEKQTSEDIICDIWKPNYFRLFISHKTEDKVFASQLKNELDPFGVSCFVAHEDIEPTREWQEEIEKALFTMDALVALLTKNFSESKWTDQEVGVAFGRKTPILPIRFNLNPYGFIGKYQAMSGHKDVKKLAREIMVLLWAKFCNNLRLLEGLVSCFENASTFKQANLLIRKIENVNSIPQHLVERLERASKNNKQVGEAFEVKKKLPNILASHKKNN